MEPVQIQVEIPLSLNPACISAVPITDIASMGTPRWDISLSPPFRLLGDVRPLDFHMDFFKSCFWNAGGPSSWIGWFLPSFTHIMQGRQHVKLGYGPLLSFKDMEVIDLFFITAASSSFTFSSVLSTGLFIHSQPSYVVSVDGGVEKIHLGMEEYFITDI